MRFMQEWGERKGRPMGCAETEITTNNPIEACEERIAFYMSTGVVFDAQSRATDGVAVCVYEKPDDWQDRESQGEVVEKRPIASMTYNKHGVKVVTPPKLVF